MTLVALDPEMPGIGIMAVIDKLIELAAEDRLSALAVATVYRDGVIESHWSFPHSPAALLGAISRLSHDFHKELDGDEA